MRKDHLWLANPSDIWEYYSVPQQGEWTKVNSSDSDTQKVLQLKFTGNSTRRANTTLQGRFSGRRKVRNLVRGRKDMSFKMNQHPSPKIRRFQDKSPNRKRPSEHALCAKLFQLCPTLCDPTDYSPPGSPVHGILQAKILEEKYISSSRGPPWPRDQTRISCISCTSKWILYHRITREAEFTYTPSKLSKGKNPVILRHLP